MNGRLIIQNCSVCALALCEGPANNNCLLSFKQLVVTTTNSRTQQEMWKVKALFLGFNKICPELLVYFLSDLLRFLSTKMCLCRHPNFNLYTTSNHGDFFFFCKMRSSCVALAGFSRSLNSFQGDKQSKCMGS